MPSRDQFRMTIEKRFAKDRVSLIVLNWNCKPHLKACLDSVLAQTYSNREIIFVDNASTDGSVEFVEEHYPPVFVIENQANLGYAAGMNIGIRQATGEFIIPLNVDVVLREDFVATAVHKGMRKDSRVGMVGGRVFQYRCGKTDILTDAGKYLVKRMTIKNSKNSEQEEYVFGPNGSCPIYRREMLDDIKLADGQFYDESYFAYAEDVDLHWRAQLFGWRCLFVPEVVSWHVHSASVGGKLRLIDKPAYIQKLVLTNRHRNIIKNLPAALVWRYLPYLVLTELMTLFYFLTRRPRNTWVIFAAMAETLRAWRQTLRYRKQIQNHKRVSNAYVRKLFKGF